jgi:hypothetical protein
VELACDEEWMISELNGFDKLAVRAVSVEDHACFFKLFTVFVVEFVAVAVTFVD